MLVRVEVMVVDKYLDELCVEEVYVHYGRLGVVSRWNWLYTGVMVPF